MQKFLVCAAVLLTSAVAFGARQQVDPEAYSCPGLKAFEKRYDGLCFDKTYKTPVLVTNGEVTIPQNSPVWAMDFTTLQDGEDVSSFQFDGTPFDGTAGVVNLMTFPNGFRLGYAAIVGQTLNLDADAGSLDVGGDQVADDGWMIFTGYAGATGRPFVIGRDAAFKTCLTFSLEDASGTDDFHFGFRRAEAANATVDNYLDMASLSIVTNANPALIQIETINDNAATTTTSTTDTLADATKTTWCVLVGDDGAVTYTINGHAPTVTAAFAFDDGDPVVPFLDFLQHGDFTGEVDLYRWVTSYQE